MTIFDPIFWAYAFERAVKTAAQTSVGLITAELILAGVGWPVVLVAVGVATLASVLTSIVNAPDAFEQTES